MQFELDILCLSTYTTVATDSISKQGRPDQPTLPANCKKVLFVHCTSYVVGSPKKRLVCFYAKIRKMIDTPLFSQAILYVQKSEVQNICTYI